MSIAYKPPLGAYLDSNATCTFNVWAPKADTIELCLLNGKSKTYYSMNAIQDGYYTVTLPNIWQGQRYLYRLNNDLERPDPASCYQPDGVHGPSAVVDVTFSWQSQPWYNHALQDYVLYELHVGTFTVEGTFTAIIPHLDKLKSLGITALSIMPVAQFPGDRNWGYDGVQLFAVQNNYGGPAGLQQLVDACHLRGLAVILDVVYNHLGPEGNYLHDYGNYFTNKYPSGWGDALNFDGPHSDDVRHFFLQNALYWLNAFRIDGLRLDATHALFDLSAVTFLEDLSKTVNSWAIQNQRRVYLIAENDRSDARLTQAQTAGGVGIDAQWLDDMHHTLHVHLTGEQTGYYADYGNFELLVKVLQEGFAYSGEYSKFHQRKHGTSSKMIPGDRFIVATQTHDQVGNRMLGERLSMLTDFDGLKLAAGTVILSPYIPMLFMGEEYAETAPFFYFIDHNDPELVRAVQAGRKAEFAYFADQGELPDPKASATFLRSKLDHTLHLQGHHKQIFEFYQTLLILRKQYDALRNPDKAALHMWHEPNDQLIFIHRTGLHSEIILILNFNLTYNIQYTPAMPVGIWQLLFDSNAPRWQGEIVEHRASPPAKLSKTTSGTLTLAPKSFVLYVKEQPLDNEEA